MRENTYFVVSFIMKRAEVFGIKIIRQSLIEIAEQFLARLIRGH